MSILSSSQKKSTIWLIADRVIAAGLGFFVTILVARYLAPELYGKLSYLIAVTMILGPLMSLGLNGIITREVINRSLDTGVILGTAVLLRLAMGLMVLGLFAATVYYFDLTEFGMEALFLIGASTFNAGLVFDFWLQSKLMNDLAAKLRIALSLMAAIARVYGVDAEYSFSWFIGVQVTHWILIGISFTGVFLWKRDSVQKLRLNVSEASYLLRSGGFLMISGVAAIIYLKIDQVMIANMLGNSAVGHYAIAAKLSEIWYFLPQAVVISVFPMILKMRSESSKLYYEYIQRLNNGLFFSAVLIALSVTFSANWLIGYFFGPAYAPAASVLIVHIWGGTFIFMRVLVSRWLLAENFLKLSMATQMVGAAINVVANIIFIPRYGIEGAAYATLASYFFSTYVILCFDEGASKMRDIITRSLFYPIILIYEKLVKRRRFLEKAD